MSSLEAPAGRHSAERPKVLVEAAADASLLIPSGPGPNCPNSRGNEAPHSNSDKDGNTVANMIPRLAVQNGHEAVVSVCLKRQIVANALGNQGTCSDRTSFYLHLLRILPLDFDRLPPLARVCALGQGSCYFVRNGHHQDGKNCGTHDPPELIAQAGGLAFAAPRKRLMANRAT